jgi:RNA polymerase sigma factor (sigma-70 family)
VRIVNTVLRYIRKMVAVEDSRSLQDRELLRRFIDGRDEAAFATLVERHGPMLLGACRRLLRNQQDAEDVLQATFLVLARRASAIRRQDSVGSWLYGVAYRLALKLRTRQARQQECERRAAITGTPNTEQMTWGDLQPVLDEELQRLPDKYRAPILLCCLQGKSRDEAARELGWAEGAVKIRLERGRELLRSRLARRGLVLSAGLWAVLVTKETATAALPVRLTATLVETSVRFAAGHSLAGAVPATVLSLSESCLKTMLLAKLKNLVAGLFLLTALGLGAATYAPLATRPMPDLASDEAAPAPAPADRVPDARAELAPLSSPQDLPGVVPLPEPPSVRGILRSTQVADTRRVTLELPEQPRREGKEPRPAESRTYRLRADARVIINGVESGFADLQPGMDLSLELSDDQKMVICARATSKQ